MQGRLVSSQSWYKSARFENKIQNENYQKVIIGNKTSKFPFFQFLTQYSDALVGNNIQINPVKWWLMPLNSWDL